MQFFNYKHSELFRPVLLFYSHKISSWHLYSQGSGFMWNNNNGNLRINRWYLYTGNKNFRTRCRKDVFKISSQLSSIRCENHIEFDWMNKHKWIMNKHSLNFPPRDISETEWRSTETAPALCPKSVTQFGSPPKLWIFCWTHLRTMFWSLRPAFPVASGWSKDENPGD